ncbi:MAG TPA: hypothetical protein EYQ50_06870 [Verrucomicrobiales bacterium]|nr:hypothetical protein [Verrucomicrobiales bacterium]HIL71261.1 hypothetical protein [Verrucomicrobiota bacterium]
MTEFTIILIAAAMANALSRIAKLPVIPMLMAMGVGLTVTGLVHPAGIPGDFRDNTFQFGLNVLVFTAGIELSPSRFIHQRKAVFLVGLVQFTVAGGVGFSVARLLGFDHLVSIYFGMALSTSSTLVVLQQLQQWLRIFESFGRLVTGVLLVQDLLMILGIVVISELVHGPLSIIGGVIKTSLLFGLALIIRQWFMPWFILKAKRKQKRLEIPAGTPPRLDEESLLMVMISVLFAFAGLSNFLELPHIAGVFMAGFSLSSFPVNEVVRSVMNSISDFFLAFFFTTLGATIIIPGWDFLGKALILTLTVLIITPPLVTIVSEKCGLNARSSIESGLLLAQTSEFSLILGITGMHLGHISEEVYSIMVFICVVTMMLTPFLARDQVVGRILQFHRIRKRIKPGEVFLGKDHILVLGLGAKGMWVLKPLKAKGHQILVIDDDPLVVAQLERAGISTIRGDGGDEKVLELASADHASLILCSLPRIRDAEKVIRFAKGVPVIVRVFEECDYRRIEAIGGIPLSNALASASTFMEWYEKVGSGALKST